MDIGSELWVGHRGPRPAGNAAAVGGIGLLELLVVLAVAASITGFALPSFQHWLEDLALRDRAQALVAALNLARSEAISRGSRVEVCKSANRSDCSGSGDWSTGWITYAYESDPDPSAPANAVLRSEGPAPRLTVQGNRPVADYVSYTSLGHARRHDGALQMGTFIVCRHGHQAIHVVMANSGRLRLVRTQNSCP